MLIPTSTFAVAAFVVMFVPGFVFAVVRIWMRGFRADDKGIDARVAQSLVVSVVIDSFYLIVAYGWLSGLVEIGPKTIQVIDPGGLGFAILLGAVIVPGVLSAIIYRPWRVVLKRLPDWYVRFRESMRRLAQRLPIRIDVEWLYRSTPTAWDWSAARADPRYVRIRLPDGRYVGGEYSDDSYVSTFPEPRDIFIRHPWRFNSKGEFAREMSESLGMWMTVPDGAIVDWLRFQWKTEKSGATDDDR